MKKYSVKVTAQAQEHIRNYASYIKNELHNAAAAKKYVKAIWKELASLEDMPQRFPCLQTEPWETTGVRKMVYKGYLVYYLIDAEKAEVSVVGVVLGKREQIAQLEQMNFESVYKEG